MGWYSLDLMHVSKEDSLHNMKCWYLYENGLCIVSFFISTYMIHVSCTKEAFGTKQ